MAEKCDQYSKTATLINYTQLFDRSQYLIVQFFLALCMIQIFCLNKSVDSPNYWHCLFSFKRKMFSFISKIMSEVTEVNDLMARFVNKR